MRIQLGHRNFGPTVDRNTTRVKLEFARTPILRRKYEDANALSAVLVP